MQFQQCFRDEMSKCVVFKFRGVQLVMCAPSGDMMLSCVDPQSPARPLRGQAYLLSMQDALRPLGITVSHRSSAQCPLLQRQGRGLHGVLISVCM